VNQPSPNAPVTSSGRGLQVLILEPDEKVAAEILSALEQASPGARAAVAQSLSEAQHLAHDQKPALFVLDVDATYDLAQEFIYDLRTSHPGARAIILTAIHFSAQREQVAGLGAIHFFEKPFPRADFITLVEALLAPGSEVEGGERFQGTLSDLHIADIIQLKCISKSTSMLEFTGPKGEKARVYFENGQVRHAATPTKVGLAAFNEIVDWKGGVISEVPVPHGTPHTINIEWQMLLMDAVRSMDESRETAALRAAAPRTAGPKVLVIDDSMMLLSFVKEILGDEGYDVSTAANGEEGLNLSRSVAPDMILLDFVLPDMKGDEVCRRLLDDAATAGIPVVYVSGFGTDLQPDRTQVPNVKGSISKPFTSDTLIKAVDTYLPESVARPNQGQSFAPPSEVPSSVESSPAAAIEPFSVVERSQMQSPSFTAVDPVPPTAKEVGSQGEAGSREANGLHPTEEQAVVRRAEALPVDLTAQNVEPPAQTTAYFSGDSSFFSLHWALRTIAREKVTGTLRAFWSQDSVDLLARDGQVVVVTTSNMDLYCEEAPVTLLNVDSDRVEAARARQAKDGCPLFVTLADEGLILREPGLQLVQHYGQRLFAQLWTGRVRFVFEQHDLPGYAAQLVASDDDIDQWALTTLRFIQYQQLNVKLMPEMSCIPAYTREGYERVQSLRLTAAEAQFASQFNGARSIQQITKNLRLDIKFARLTLFRFLALEIVECWPGQAADKVESRSGIRGIFGR